MLPASACVHFFFINNAISLKNQRPVIHSENLFFMAKNDGAKKETETVFENPSSFHFCSEGAGGAWF